MRLHEAVLWAVALAIILLWYLAGTQPSVREPQAQAQRPVCVWTDANSPFMFQKDCDP